MPLKLNCSLFWHEQICNFSKHSDLGYVRIQFSWVAAILLFSIVDEIFELFGTFFFRLFGNVREILIFLVHSLLDTVDNCHKFYSNSEALYFIAAL